jgi:probable poly-beta-1,6-N-acetyl-D-glucosamine export protein
MTLHSSQYHPAVDALRVISILAVIAIHTTTRTLEVTHFDLSHTLWTLYLNQAARFAVPLFFMISGFVLELSYSHHSGFLSYLKNRISRLFIPYLVWSAVYYFFIYTHHSDTFWSALLSGSSSWQLYFIPTILLFYLVFPLLHSIYRHLSRPAILLVLGTFQLYLLYQDYFYHSISFFYPLVIALLNFYIFILGMVAFHHYQLLLRLVSRWKILLAVITVLLSLYVFREGYLQYQQTNNYLSFYSQWRPSVFFYTLSLAGLLYSLFSRTSIPVSLVKSLSGLSFFVFFFHIIVLEFIWKHWGIFQNIRQLWFDPVFFFLVACLSFTAAFLVHKVPGLAKITG